MKDPNRTFRLIESAPNDWGRLIATSFESSKIQDDAATMAMRAIYIAAYIAVWNAGRPHKLAVRQAQNAVKAARRAMGYSYPEKHPLIDFEITNPFTAFLSSETKPS